jgi:hypothetical protein
MLPRLLIQEPMGRKFELAGVNPSVSRPRLRIGVALHGE